MPGAYAHITLVNVLKETQRLENIPDFPTEAIPAVLDYFKYCEQGAVSPDYPYLAVGDSGAARWADSMHYTRTGEMIHAGIRHLRGMHGDTQRKGLAWLLGYSAHVGTDVTIHPVVELKVGPYEENKTDHRICEMHQDTYIFQRMNLDEIGLSEHLDSGISTCNDQADKDLIDPDIRHIWTAMLEEVYPDDFANNPPDIDKWHNRFNFFLDKFGEEGNRLVPIARHVAANIVGVTYPLIGEVDTQYINNLDVPGGKEDYDTIFDNAINNVGKVWALVASAIYDNNNVYLTEIGNWNLDTGRDDNGQYVFWR